MPRGDLVENRAADPAQRKEWDEHDVFGGAVAEHSVVLALGQVVVILDRGDGHDLPGPLDLVDSDVRKPDVKNLAAVAVLLDRRETVLERGLRVDPVQVVQSYALGPQPAKAVLDLGAEDLRPPTSRSPAPALGGHNAAVRDRLERKPDRFFALATRV